MDLAEIEELRSELTHPLRDPPDTEGTAKTKNYSQADSFEVEASFSSVSHDGGCYYDKKEFSRVLTVGDVFAHKEVRLGHVLTSDFVADSEDTRVLCFNGFDYQIAVDKLRAQERRDLAVELQRLKSLEHWDQAKFESFSSLFKSKRH